MKVNVNRIGCKPILNQHFNDGSLIACRVDKFPSDNPSYKKRDGFRMNDVSLLDRLSFGMNFDEDLARIVASRVKEMPKDDVSNLSEQDMMALLRPAYVQTASEIKEWDERVYQYVNDTMSVKVEDVQSVVDSANSSVVNDDPSVNEKTE